MKKIVLPVWLILAIVSSTSCGAPKDPQWHAENGFRWADLDVPGSGKTGFTVLSSDKTGITFTNTLNELEGAANRVLFDGSGVAVGDFDNDGLLDIYLCGLNTRNVLYKNLGKWKFKDVTKESGPVCPGGYYRGAVFADVNGDNHLDLLVASIGKGVLCFLNDGQGKFIDFTKTAGTASKFGSATLALADVDGNGTLDLYVANNRMDDMRDRGQVDLQVVKGKLTVPPWLKDRLLAINNQVLEYGEPDQLFLNDGTGRFTAVSWTDGTFLDEEGNKLPGPPLDWGLAAMLRDMNDDGTPDLYVCNDFWTPDRVWINDGKGRFHAIKKLALRCTSSSSMGVDFADIDRDGNLDFIVVDMLSRDPRLRKRQLPAQYPIITRVTEIDSRPQITRNTLFHNRGDGTYAEIANFSGLEASEWSWSPAFLDVDLDGNEDLLITTGHIKDTQDLDAESQIKARQHSWKGFTNAVERQKAFTRELMLHNHLYPHLDTPIVAFHNLGNLQFADVTKEWGTAAPGVHHSMAIGDFDNDGDLDFVVNNLGSAAGVFRNDSISPRVAIRLKGSPPNTQAIGAKANFLGGAVPKQSKEVIAGGRYLAGSDTELVFATGKAEKGMSLEIQWRNGKASLIQDIAPNRIYEVSEAEVSKVQSPESKVQSRAQPFFKDVSQLLNHGHHEELYDDFARQPLLPKRLSQPGPGVAWFDADGDGWDDLLIGSGRGGQLALFVNDRQGGFKPRQEAPFTHPVTRDQTGIVGWKHGTGKSTVLAGSANYEDGLPIGSVVRQYDLIQRAIDDSLPGQPSSTGPLALADFDNDEDLDLFVGGQCVPGRYPEPASSLLFRSEDGQWQLDAENSKLLTDVGLVNGAVWSDLDGDGWPELVLACEWGPIKVFKNQSGKLREATNELGLDKYTGWWNGVTTGDIDGDGQMDIIASNWGLNSEYRAKPDQPLRLYYGNLGSRGTMDLIESEYDSARNLIAPRRRLDVVAASLPFLLGQFPSHKAYSEATMTGVLGDRQSLARQVQANILASMVFFNRGNRFEGVELPREAQFSPGFSVNVADFNGDGHEDIFISQNFFATQSEMPRLDAGRGLWLQGDGTGKLKAVPGQESGIEVYGEQRGAAAGDFNRDGRIDLVVSQNGATTRLFQNVAAKPGLRVRLAGPPGNPTVAGAILRLKFGQRLGPAREIHAGSGYLSQDSSTQVMGMPEIPTQVWVRWPGGRTTLTDLPLDVREIALDENGSLQESSK